MIDVLLFTVGILMSSFGAILLKVGGSALKSPAFTYHWMVELCTNRFVIGGVFLYLIPTLIWVYLLRKYPVTLVHPIIAVTYSATPLLAVFFLKESVSPVRWMGIFVTFLGIVIVSRG